MHNLNLIESELTNIHEKGVRDFAEVAVREAHRIINAEDESDRLQEVWEAIRASLKDTLSKESKDFKLVDDCVSWIVWNRINQLKAGGDSRLLN